MATAVVELIFEGKENKKVEVTYRDGIKSGGAKFNAIEKAIEKQFSDEDWIRWNLISIAD